MSHNSNATHFAVIITEENRKALKLINTIAPSKAAVGDIYVFPYDPNAEAEILFPLDFLRNFSAPSGLDSTRIHDVTRRPSL